MNEVSNETQPVAEVNVFDKPVDAEAIKANVAEATAKEASKQDAPVPTPVQ